MTLKTRVAKIESLVGRGRVPSENDFQDALALKQRHFNALYLPEILSAPVDPDEVAAMQIAEKSGQIAAAQDLVRRYWRARGVDSDERERRLAEEIRAELVEIFGDGIEK